MFIKKFALIFAKQYTSLGGQAVIEGVMMRSPNAFVVAVRKADGKIRLRKDQWFGLSKKYPFFKKPFLRGVLMLVESMANGIVALNYSANIAMAEEMKEKALKSGMSEADLQKKMKAAEKVSFSTFLTIASSFILGMGLFVFLPHTLTAWLSSFFDLQWSLDGFAFHAFDGLIKAMIFILYIFLIGFLPDIRKVFQYHGAEHKSISTFEAEETLEVSNAKKYTTLHPRCGTSFIFFLLLVSIVLFSAIFSLVSFPAEYSNILKHFFAIIFKVFLMFPIAGISYELIKIAGKYPSNPVLRLIGFPGLMLQKLTTKEPTDSQLEVALASIKTVLYLEKKYSLNEAKEKVLKLEETEITSVNEIDQQSDLLKEFLEV
ncbi:MAG: DUF1385 domain-containing protein [Bacteriovoracaceae bacterium]|nr:DUF1385 domain-containing protein [Bacteriovoracaceae bacterium]